MRRIVALLLCLVASTASALELRGIPLSPAFVAPTTTGACGTNGWTFTGDTNTGLCSTGADQVGLETAGVQRILVTTTTTDMAPAGTAVSRFDSSGVSMLSSAFIRWSSGAPGGSSSLWTGMDAANVWQQGVDAASATGQTIKSHDITTAGTNVDAPTLTASSGKSTGSGKGEVRVAVATPGTPGTTQNTPVDRLAITPAGLRAIQQVAPTIGACGTDPAVTAGSTNTSGQLTVGTGGTDTSCTLTFNGAYAAAPRCTLNRRGASATAYVSSTTTTTMVLAIAAADAGVVVDYLCIAGAAT